MKLKNFIKKIRKNYPKKKLNKEVCITCKREL